MFKLRYTNHVCSFRNERYKHATELSKYIWALKDKNMDFSLEWRKIKQAKAYTNVTKNETYVYGRNILYFVFVSQIECPPSTMEMN